MCVKEAVSAASLCSEEAWEGVRLMVGVGVLMCLWVLVGDSRGG